MKSKQNYIGTRENSKKPAQHQVQCITVQVNNIKFVKPQMVQHARENTKTALVPTMHVQNKNLKFPIIVKYSI